MVLLLLGNSMGIWDDFQKFIGVQQQQVAAPQPTEAPTKPDYFERLKIAESGGDSDVKAKTSTATGHHQFIESTWQALVTKHGKTYSLEDRKDPIKSLEIAKLFTEDNRRILSKALGGEPTDTQLYTAHFLGTTGAKKFLMAGPTVLANKVVDARQVAANKNIFFDEKKKPRTVSQVYSILQKKIDE